MNSMSSTKDQFKKVPFVHMLAFCISKWGFRVSRVVWKIAYKFKGPLEDGTPVKLPSGFVMEVDSKDWTSRTIYEGTYERPLLNFLSLIAAENLVIDVGANIGVTLWSSIKHSEEVSYLAFDPAPVPYSRLQNFLNSISNPGNAFRIGLSDESGVAQLFGIDNPEHSGLASYTAMKSEVGRKMMETEVRKLDEILEELNVNGEIDLIKIDVEGFEGKVLRGAERVIDAAQFRFLILEVSPELCDITYLKWLEAKTSESYRWFEISERGMLRRTTCLFQVDLESALSSDKQWNLIAIRKDEVARFKSLR
jgi:FkbM family methyltransferase